MASHTSRHSIGGKFRSHSLWDKRALESQCCGQEVQHHWWAPRPLAGYPLAIRWKWFKHITCKGISAMWGSVPLPLSAFPSSFHYLPSDSSSWTCSGTTPAHRPAPHYQGAEPALRELPSTCYFPSNHPLPTLTVPALYPLLSDDALCLTASRCSWWSLPSSHK